MGNAFLPRFHRSRVSRWAKSGTGRWPAFACGPPSGLSAAPAPAPDPAAAATVYRQAMESFNKEDYSRALDLLGHIPDTGKPGEQADVLNLRGAVYLHQHQYDKARAAFTKAD